MYQEKDRLWDRKWTKYSKNRIYMTWTQKLFCSFLKQFDNFISQLEAFQIKVSFQYRAFMMWFSGRNFLFTRSSPLIFYCSLLSFWTRGKCHSTRCSKGFAFLLEQKPWLLVFELKEVQNDELKCGNFFGGLHKLFGQYFGAKMDLKLT